MAEWLGFLPVFFETVSMWFQFRRSVGPWRCHENKHKLIMLQTGCNLLFVDKLAPIRKC